ncbi:hypothetical protein ACROYT_G002270 [Oculina patagonica]
MLFAVVLVLASLPCSFAFGGQFPVQGFVNAQECSSHQFLEGADRLDSAPGGFQEDFFLQYGWYRFRGAAGNMMPTSCTPVNKCGTQATGWLQGRHPSQAEGAISATVCFHWTTSCCDFSTSIQVRNCGSFYVYQLPRTGFGLRYCGAQGSVSGLPHPSEKPWKYGETVYGFGSTVYGPKDWNVVSAHCTGNSQSPINIVTSTVYVFPYQSVFRFTPDNVMGSVSGELVNNGHSPTFTIDKSRGTALLTGGPWGNNVYKLEQLHFHFGCDALKGSEHTVDGQAYSGELHLVAYNTNYPDFDSAAVEQDGLTDNNGDPWNPEWQQLSVRMGQITNADSNIKVPMNLNLYNLVPQLRDLSRTSFYSYRGSLTTPPCHQSVNWIVMQYPIPTSREVMAAMRSLHNHEGHSMCDNFRPTQPLNRRTVSKYSGPQFG